MCVKKYVFLFFSILFFTLPMSLLDVMSDGINSWDQMGYDASGSLIYVWLDPLMGSFCEHFEQKDDIIRSKGNTNNNNIFDDLNYDERKNIKNTDTTNTSCRAYYEVLKKRYDLLSKKCFVMHITQNLII